MPGEQLGQQCTAEVVELGGDGIPVGGVDPLLPFRRGHQNNRAGPDFGRLFEIEQELLALEPARVAGQLAVLADDPVARNRR